MLRAISALAAAVAIASIQTAAIADDGMTKATAEALFVDGKRLMDAGEYASACPKFAASQKLDPGIGTALNLAACYEIQGKTASAWAEFRSAASSARAIGSKDREQLAGDRARALEDKLSYLTITTSNAQAAAVQIARDGSAIESAVLGTPIPVDPGRHTVEAIAPGKRKWSVAVDVADSASRVTVSVPELGDIASTPGWVGGAAAPGAGGYGTTQRGVGVGLAAVGVVGLVVGTIFGIKASSSWTDAKAGCSSYPSGCRPESIHLADDARAAGISSNIAFALGGASLAAGAVLYFTAPAARPTDKKVAIRLDPSGVAVSGRF